MTCPPLNASKALGEPCYDVRTDASVDPANIRTSRTTKRRIASLARRRQHSPCADIKSMLNKDLDSSGAEQAPPASTPGICATARISLLTDRQRSYLRLVLQNRNSKEIAAVTGSSHRAVDKQLLKANNVLGVPSRFEAARLLADHDGRVEPLPPTIDLASAKPTFPLPPAVPATRGQQIC